MKVLLYLRYVDDINIVVKNMAARVESDKPKDEANMLFVQQIANTIDPSIQVTIDYPSRHSDVKMPILDLKVWPSQEQDPETREVSVTIMHEHYHKEVGSRAVVNAKSALPHKMKRTIHTQEIIRILRNCSRQLPWEVTRAHIEEYVTRMQFSGYTRDFRAEVVRSALSAYDCMVKRDADGEEPLYRPKGWKKVERVKARRARKDDWFRERKGKGEHDNESVVFVPATPGGVMRKRYVEAIEKAGVKIGVAEVPGPNLKQRLQRSDPFKEKKCTGEGCLVCEEGDGGRCRTNGVT